MTIFPQLLLLLLSFLSLAAADRLVSIVNKCPGAIPLYINGVSQGSLAHNAVTSRTYADSWSGLIYTTENDGDENGARTTRAGFYGQTNYYYIVKDPSHLNVGVSVVPKVISSLSGNFCASATCDSTSCPSSYSQTPTSFPYPSGSAPAAPLFSCPGTDVGYTITFCPEKTLPPPPGFVTIHPSASSKKCLDVRGAAIADGTAVQVYDCNGTSAQRWLLSTSGSSTKVRLAGTDLCLNVGTDPKNGAQSKLSSCTGSTSWVYTGKHLKLASKNQCLDLTKGLTSNGNIVQTWTCQNAGKDNQGWVAS